MTYTDWPAKISSSYLRPGQCTFVKLNDRENKDYCIVIVVDDFKLKLLKSEPDSSPVVTRSPININVRCEVKGRLRGDGQGSVLFVSLLPITPRAPFGYTSRVPSSACNPNRDEWE